MVEIYLPKNYGLPSYDLTKLTLFTEIVPPGGDNASSSVAITASEVLSGSTTLLAGQYAVVTQPLSFPASAFTYTTRPSSTELRLSLSISGGKLTITPQVDKSPNGINLIVDPVAAFSIPSLHSVELDDPRLVNITATGSPAPAVPIPSAASTPSPRWASRVPFTSTARHRIPTPVVTSPTPACSCRRRRAPSIMATPIRQESSPRSASSAMSTRAWKDMAVPERPGGPSACNPLRRPAQLSPTGP